MEENNTTTTQGDSPPSNGQEKGTTNSQQVVVRRFSPFEEGVIDGVIRSGTTPFQEFIEHSETVDLIEKQLSFNRQRTQAKEAEYEKVKAELLKWKKVFFVNTEADRLQQEKIDKLDWERRELKSLAQQCREKVEGMKMEFPLFPALLFFLAAMVFIVADVFFTNQVVGYLFDMQEEEGLLIAIGLASITFLIKPAIDRMLEKPYRENRHFQRIHGFYLIVGIAALVMLGYLGYLRLEGVGLQGTTEVDASASVTIQDITQPDNEGAVEASREDAIIHSFSSQVLFIMSSILFALAGAICLSISLPNLTLAERKIRYRALVRIYLRKAKNIWKSIEYARSKQNEYKVAWQEAELQFDLLRPIEMLEDEWNALIREGDKLLDKLTSSEIQKEKALYLEGYSRGTKFKMNGDLYFSPYQVLRWVFMHSSGPKKNGREPGGNTSPPKTTNSTPTKRGDYLHQEIRRMIDFTFTRNQNDYYNDEN